jgi:hypothetical protein
MTDHQILEIILSEIKYLKIDIKDQRKEIQEIKESTNNKMNVCRREVDGEIKSVEKEMGSLKMSMIKLVLIASASGATGGIAGKLLTIF